MPEANIMRNCAFLFREIMIALPPRHASRRPLWHPLGLSIASGGHVPALVALAVLKEG